LRSIEPTCKQKDRNSNSAQRNKSEIKRQPEQKDKTNSGIEGYTYLLIFILLLYKFRHHLQLDEGYNDRQKNTPEKAHI
jgi:hypothetical protein